MRAARFIQLMRGIFAVLFALPFAVKSFNVTYSVQNLESFDPCDPTLNEWLRSQINIFPSNLTSSDFDLNQFNYDLRTIYRLEEDSWYDYIVIGAGTAGSIVASRLSENPEVKVLLIEAGGKEDWVNNIPGLTFSLRKTWRDYAYLSQPQEKCCQQLVNNQLPVPRGKLIGGCSSINDGGFHRGVPGDYDLWDEIHGAKGWSYRDVFPYFIKIEDVEPNNRLDRGYHGTRGLLPVRLRDPSQFGDVVQDAMKELGLPVGDFNGQNPVRTHPAQNAFRDGLRYSTGRAYLSEASKRPNLDIFIFARADRILFDKRSKKAIGVEYTANSEKNRVFAQREIIISAGVIETPKLLMLSGIGPADHLKSLGIPILLDLPGVGKNLQNHPVVDLPYAAQTPSDDILQSINDYISHRKGMFAESDASQIFGFYRTKYAHDERPDLELAMQTASFGGLAPMDLSAWQHNWRTDIRWNYYEPYEGKNGFEIRPLVTHPHSRGWIKLSSKDPDQPPLIDFNSLDDQRDLDVLVEGCKLTHRMIQTNSMKPLQPSFLGFVEQCKGLPFFSDEYLRCMIPIMSNSWHDLVGTAKMGPPSDRYAVIDPELQVYGVQGLRVADESVMPEIVSGHTMAPTMMIGERCADFIMGRRLRPALPPFHDEIKLLSYD